VVKLSDEHVHGLQQSMRRFIGGDVAWQAAFMRGKDDNFEHMDYKVIALFIWLLY